MDFAKFVVLLSIAAMPPSGAATAQTTCHEAGRYHVVVRPAESAGQHIIVRSKAPHDGYKPCLYSVQPGDFEIRNENATHFLALEGSLLILDSGTAPEPRGLVLWDVEKRMKVYSGTYSGPYRIERDGMHFWMPTGDATDANCPLAGRWRAQGLGAAIETEVWLGFSDYRLVPGTLTRCAARQ